jgi:hydroxymethylbilane synthase
MDEVPRTAIDPDDMLPAVAQGAIGIERREADARAAEMLAAIHDHDTGLRLGCERAFLKALDGSCETPIAGLAELTGDRLTFRGEILRPDGSEVLTVSGETAAAEGAQLGTSLANDLLRRAPEGFFDWRAA